MAGNTDYGLDFDLGEEIDMLRDSVRRFAEAEIAPRAAAIDRDNDFPADLWEKMGSLGQIMGMLPGMGDMKAQLDQIDDRDVDEPEVPT